MCCPGRTLIAFPYFQLDALREGCCDLLQRGELIIGSPRNGCHKTPQKSSGKQSAREFGDMSFSILSDSNGSELKPVPLEEDENRSPAFIADATGVSRALRQSANGFTLT